jgi:hypothetical protein
MEIGSIQLYKSGYPAKCGGSSRATTHVFWHAPKKLTAPYAIKTTTAHIIATNPPKINIQRTTTTAKPTLVDDAHNMGDNTKVTVNIIPTQATNHTTTTTTPILTKQQLPQPKH